MKLRNSNGIVTVQTTLNGDVSEERYQKELAILAYRVDQLTPQPKIEFERDPEDYDDQL